MSWPMCLVSLSDHYRRCGLNWFNSNLAVLMCVFSCTGAHRWRWLSLSTVTAIICDFSCLANFVTMLCLRADFGMRWCTVWESIEVSAEHFYNKAQIKIVFCQNVLCISIHHFALKCLGQQCCSCVLYYYSCGMPCKNSFLVGEKYSRGLGVHAKGYGICIILDNFHYLFW